MKIIEVDPNGKKCIRSFFLNDTNFTIVIIVFNLYCTSVFDKKISLRSRK